ncbi:MAG: class I SAM-dependent methyltransferase [Bacteroidota bacterium]
MPSPKDNFSTQARTYQKNRPVYPAAFYEALLDLVPNRRRCWDVGTGNGQAALALAPHVEHVHATDLSARQLEQASLHPRITYQVVTAEQSGFPDRSFDLITVAQALHWFDHPAFFAEVKRVGVPGGILATWGYNLLRVSPEIDPLLDHFYHEIVGAYWDPERRLVEEAYASIDFPFSEIQLAGEWAIHDTWEVDRLEGYLRSWSSVQHYKKAHPGVDPVMEYMPRIQAVWPEGSAQAVRFPIFSRIGRI